MPSEQKESRREARTPAAERILATASELFFQHGIRAVGVDTIAADASVTKMTLYKHFGSKDALVASYLRSRDERWRGRWAEAIQRYEDPRERLLAVFDAYEGSLTDSDFRGCAFINAAAELPDLSHPAREIVSAHKAQLRGELATLAEQAGLGSPHDVAEELVLLLDGAFVTASILHAADPLRRARDMARRMVDERVATNVDTAS